MKVRSLALHATKISTHSIAYMTFRPQFCICFLVLTMQFPTPHRISTLIGYIFLAYPRYSDIYIEVRLEKSSVHAGRKQSSCLSGLLFSSQPQLFPKPQFHSQLSFAKALMLQHTGSVLFTLNRNSL